MCVWRRERERENNGGMNEWEAEAALTLIASFGRHASVLCSAFQASLSGVPGNENSRVLRVLTEDRAAGSL